MPDFIISTQRVENNQFTNEPATPLYLKVPINAASFTPEHQVSMSDFYSDIINPIHPHVIIFIHGYNTEDNEVLERHRLLRKGFEQLGYTGSIITFAWPSGSNALMYLEDRHDAKKTAFELVKSCIRFLVYQQNKDCTMNVHVIAHSTGSFVLYEAFHDATTTEGTAQDNWTVSQILFIGGDISSDSMNYDRAETIYKHCYRLTNYYNPYDSILAISNIKRAGFKNRIGRVGLPKNSPEKAVDINCGAYYLKHKDNIQVSVGAHSHSWYFYSERWFQDAYLTITGNLDRTAIPGRKVVADDDLILEE